MVSFHSRGWSSLKSPQRSVLFNISVIGKKIERWIVREQNLLMVLLLRRVERRTNYGVLRKILTILAIIGKKKMT